jgi:hypothetical protein
MWQNGTSNGCIFELIAKRDATNRDCHSRPAALPPFLPPGLRPVALRPTLSSGLPFSSYFYPQITQISADFF